MKTWALSGAVTVGLFLFAGEARAETIFTDDFSTDPNTSGKWSGFYGDAGGSGAAPLVWDEGSGQFTLAQGADNFAADNGSGGRMFANCSLTGSTWTAELDYYVGGGSAPGGLAPSDGLLIAFNAAPNANGVLGYYIFLDNFRNWWDPDSGFVGLYYTDQQIAGPPGPSPLAWVDDSRGRDAEWHHIKLDVLDGRIRFYIDDMGNPILDHTVQDYDLSRSGFGLFGLTRTDDIIVDNVAISGVYTTSPVPEPASIALLGLGALGLACRRLRKKAVA